MNIEFHYYSLYYLCARAGFSAEESEILAISSQMTDEAVTPREVVSARSSFFTEVTQNYVFWDEVVGEKVYRPFHFIPGRPETAAKKRLDGISSPYIVTADSPLSRDILIEALRTRNLFRMGIALHSYADTWAHQNFSGRSEKCNSMDPSSIIPSVGHLQALKKPDVPSGVWVDSRLKSEFATVVNADRFSAAAHMIYRFLCTYNRRGFQDEDEVVDKLEDIWRRGQSFGKSNIEGRIADYVIELDVPPFERKSWFARAIEKIPESTWRGSLLESWNRAAAEHRIATLREFSERGIK